MMNFEEGDDVTEKKYSVIDMKDRRKYEVARSFRIKKVEGLTTGNSKSSLKKSTFELGKYLNKSVTPVKSKGKLDGNESSLSGKSRYYSLKDYRIIKEGFSVKLGGLGPSSLGSESWQAKRDLYEKRQRYGKFVYNNNAANIPLFPIIHQVKGKESKIARALNFSKTIKRPDLKIYIK